MTSNAEEQATRKRPPSPAAESHQTRPRWATQAPCRARQAKVGKEGQLGRTAAQKPKCRGTEGGKLLCSPRSLRHDAPMHPG
jgi:hypothetical protein